MKTEEGTVLETNGGIARVRAGRHAECKDCGACPGSDAPVVDVRNSLNAQAGQRVLFEVREDKTLRGAFLIFIFPLIAFFAGIALGGLAADYLTLSSFLCKAIGGAVFLLIAVLIIRAFDRHIGRKEKDLPGIIKIIR